jgi:voltage-gated potassium channel
MAERDSWATRLVARPGFDFAVLILIIVSVLLLCLEIVIPVSDPRHDTVFLASNIITAMFVLELLVRYLASKRKRRFLREYWIDILAVLPLFRALRFLRLLRLLRLFRAVHLLTRQTRILEWLFRKRVTEYLFIVVLLVFATMFGTLGLAHFHVAGGGGWALLERSFWETLFTLVAGEPITEFPGTFGGRVVILMVQLSGLTFFALLTGTVSAVMIEKMREGSVFQQIQLEDLEGHVVICGFNRGVETAICELQRHPDFSDREVVVITEREELPALNVPFPSRVRAVREDFTRVDVLRKCNIERATTAIIVSEITHNRSRQDADARTVLAALTIEKLSPSVHTIAELSNSQSEFHLRMGGVNEVIVTRSIAGHLLAQAAMYSANVHLLQELLSTTTGNTLQPYLVEQELVGTSFAEALPRVYGRLGSIPVAVEQADGTLLLNPKNYQVQLGDKLICVSAAPEEES